MAGRILMFNMGRRDQRTSGGRSWVVGRIHPEAWVALAVGKVESIVTMLGPLVTKVRHH